MASASSGDAIFRIKHVHYKGNQVPMLMQNLNGPCPLLAISKAAPALVARAPVCAPRHPAHALCGTAHHCAMRGAMPCGAADSQMRGAGNALLLEKKITIHQDLAYMDFGQLIHLVGDYLVNFNPPHPNPEMQANQQQQIADALAVLPKLGRGLDVNVRHQKVADFEYTDELSVLDMLGINLVHGWLCDPQDTRTASVIKDMSYNQLICMLVDADDAAHPEPTASTEPATRSAAAASWAALPSVVSWNTSARAGVQGRSIAPHGAAEGEDSHAEANRVEQAKAQAKAERAERLRKARVVEEFLQDTASQLTWFGLEKLHQGQWEIAIYLCMCVSLCVWCSLL